MCIKTGLFYLPLQHSEARIHLRTAAVKNTGLPPSPAPRPRALFLQEAGLQDLSPDLVAETKSWVSMGKRWQLLFSAEPSFMGWKFYLEHSTLGVQKPRHPCPAQEVVVTC